MKRVCVLILGILLFCASVVAQKRVVDAVSQLPVAAASIFDATGNMVGFTWNDGEFSEVPESAYPITVRCMGYEILVIERPEEKTWKMTPKAYELEEVVIVPVNRNVLKQMFYVREYSSMYNETDTITYFSEYMADRFIPTSKDAKFGGDTSLRMLADRHYVHYQLFGEDSIDVYSKRKFSSRVGLLKRLDKKVTAPESFKEPGSVTKYYEEPGKSGMELIMKQNDRTFTVIKDGLADTKDHKASPWELKLLGFTMECNQLYLTQAYRVNDKGVYQPKDLQEVSIVMEAEGRGKYLREILESDKPIVIRAMIEYYVVDIDYLSKEEAKDEYKNKPTDVKFVIPSTIPPLNEATKRLVERANDESEKLPRSSSVTEKAK